MTEPTLQVELHVFRVSAVVVDWVLIVSDLRIAQDTSRPDQPRTHVPIQISAHTHGTEPNIMYS